MRLQLVALAVAVLGLAGCGDDTPGSSDLRDAIDDQSSTCAELISIKNDMDPKSPDYEEAPDLLRAVGCFSVDSERTD